MKKKKLLGGRNPVTARLNKRKAALVNFLGGRCSFCGYNKCTRNIAFHHCFDKETGINATKMGKHLECLYREIRKCIMVCHNCHGEIHEGMIDAKDKYIEFQKTVETLKGKTWKEITVD